MKLRLWKVASKTRRHPVYNIRWVFRAGGGGGGGEVFSRETLLNSIANNITASSKELCTLKFLDFSSFNIDIF